MRHSEAAERGWGELLPSSNGGALRRASGLPDRPRARCSASSAPGIGIVAFFLPDRRLPAGCAATRGRVWVLRMVRTESEPRTKRDLRKDLKTVALMGTGLFLSIVHSYMRGDFAGRVHYAAALAAISVLLVSGRLFQLARREGLRDRGDFLLTLVASIVLSVIIGFAMFGVLTFFATQLDAAVHLKSPWPAVSMVLLGGGVFYGFRLHARACYGVVEVLSAAFITFWKTSDSALVAVDKANLGPALLTAGIYLVVRGFDNVREGTARGSNGEFKDWLLSTVANTWSGWQSRPRAKTIAAEQSAEDT